MALYLQSGYAGTLCELFPIASQSMTDVLREHEYVTLKVFVSGSPQAKNEEKVFKHLKTIKSTHAGSRLIRMLRDSFELPGEKGPHACLVHEALGLTLKQLRAFLMRKS